MQTVFKSLITLFIVIVFGGIALLLFHTIYNQLFVPFGCEHPAYLLFCDFNSSDFTITPWDLIEALVMTAITCVIPLIGGFLIWGTWKHWAGR